MRTIVISFGILITALLLLYRLLALSVWRQELSSEIWVGLFSVIFFALGIYFSREIFRSRKLQAEANPKSLAEIGLSGREYEILRLIADGLSNQQIADRLFLSEHTVKKHISNIFGKLKAERRTDAVRMAKELKILD